MKVLHLETGRHLYGGALQVLLLLQGLCNPNDRHALICPRASAIAQAAREQGLEVHELPLGGELDPLAPLRLARLLRRERPDLLHVHSRRGADLWGGIAAHWIGTPAVLSRRVDNAEPPWLVARKYRLYKRVITISQGIRQVLLSEGLPPEKVVCVPSSVDTRRYRPGGDRDWLHREFGFAPDAKVMAMIAQLIPRKGHATLLEALPQVLKDHPQTRLLILGRGPLEEQLKADCRHRDLDSHVTFAGFREDLPRLLPTLDLVVHPAFMEGLGVALLQAAACGVPIVAGRAGGIPEIVVHEHTGLLVEPGDATALAAAIDHLLSDPQQAGRYARAARERVLERFSIPAMVTGNRQVYESVLSETQRQV